MSKCGHKIVILTGVDKVGKTSIWEEINKQTKYKHFIIDRFVEGFLAYKELYNKPDELCNPIELELFDRKISELPHILIHLDCSTEELTRRFKEHNEPWIDIDKNRKIYEKYVNKSPLQKIKIDTTNRTAKDVVEELIKLNLI